MPDGVTPDALAAVSDDQLRAGGHEPPEGGVPPRPVRQGDQRRAAAPLARRDERRRGDCRDDQGQGNRPLVGRDVPDVPAAPARRAAGRRPRDRDRGAERVPAAQEADGRAHSEDRRGVAAVSLGGVAGISGAVSTTSRKRGQNREFGLDERCIRRDLAASLACRSHPPRRRTRRAGSPADSEMGRRRGARPDDRSSSSRRRRARG